MGLRQRLVDCHYVDARARNELATRQRPNNRFQAAVGCRRSYMENVQTVSLRVLSDLSASSSLLYWSAANHRLSRLALQDDFSSPGGSSQVPLPQHLFRKGFLDRLLRHSSQFFGVKEGSVDRP